jgi:dolichyl-phosphate beta-glucosyltransferase
MLSDFSVSLILPAYNEVRVISQTISEVKTYFESRQYAFEIIVAADGHDGTRELVSEMAGHDPTLRVIGSPVRQGKGCGIRQAVAIAEGTVIGFADADNKTPIEEFDKFIPLLRDGYEVVIGSRKLGQSQIERAQPSYRRLGSAGFRLVKSAIVGLPDIADTQCGFKFFQRQIAQELFARQRIDGYMFDVEILYLARRSGYRIAQLPVRWRDDGDSRLVLLSGNLRNVADLFRIRFGQFPPARLSQAPKGLESK